MTEPSRTLAKYEDLLALEDDVRAEVIGGELVTLPSPLPRHSKVQGALRRFVGGPFDDDDGEGGPGGWWIFVEIDVRLTVHDIVRPDLSGWRRERLPRPGSKRPIDVVPDWISEIVSPSTGARDRVAKRALYAKHGVLWYWLVDPVTRTLEALRLERGTWVDAGSFDDSHVARVPPFEAIELPIGRLFLPREADTPED